VDESETKSPGGDWDSCHSFVTPAYKRLHCLLGSTERRDYFKEFLDCTFMASAEGVTDEVITGVWGRSPQRGQGASTFLRYVTLIDQK